MSNISDQDLEVIFNIEEGLNIYLLDHHFNYVFFNEVHKKEMKEYFDAEIALGKSKIDYLPSPFNEDFKQLYQRALDTESFKHVLKFTEEYIEFRFYPYRQDSHAKLLVKTRRISSDIIINQELEKYRERLEEQVRERTEEISSQRDFFQKLIDEDPSLIFLRDQMGTYRLVNLSMAQALKQTTTQVIGTHISSVILDPQLAKKYMEEDQNIISTGESVHENRQFYVDRQDIKWLSVRKKRIRIANEYFVLGVMSDITNLINTRVTLEQTNQELKSTIDDLKEMQLRLVTTEKIASILLLTSGFMHEISNPINYVSGNVLPLKQDIEDLQNWLEASGWLSIDENRRKEYNIVASEIKTLLTGIEEGTARVKNLVQNLKKLSYSHPEIETNCDFQEIIDGVITMLSLLLEQKEIIIQKDYHSKKHQIHTNPNYLNQIIINVMDYVVSRMYTGEKLIIRTADKDDLIQIEVIDENRGLPAEEINRMIEPFDKIESDTKVGLAVSYRIATKMNGFIKTHHEDKKTHFSILLPVHNR